MKTIIFSLSLMCLISTILVAQDDVDNRTKLAFGLKVGANYSNVYDSEGEDFEADPKLGFATGAFLSIPIGKYMGIQPEVLFSQKGFEATGRILGGGYNLTRTSNYLDVPLMFAVKPAPFLTLLAGPQFSYLISQKDAFKNGTSTIEQEKEFENDNIRKNTLCFLGGVDINISHVVLSARAGWDIQNNAGDGSSSTPRYKNVWYQATVGYRFY
jgi:Outer membrane protein beta-barrel domain